LSRDYRSQRVASGIHQRRHARDYNLIPDSGGLQRDVDPQNFADIKAELPVDDRRETIRFEAEIVGSDGQKGEAVTTLPSRSLPVRDRGLHISGTDCHLRYNGIAGVTHFSFECSVRFLRARKNGKPSERKDRNG
jgi:hypothetical protein